MNGAIIIFLAAIAAGFVIRRRGRQTRTLREPLAAVVDNVRRALADRNDVEIGIAVRDTQARWLRNQELITSDSIIATVRGVRATITHAGAADARAVLDDLQRQASAHPEGVPGHVVANARLQFDELMRANLQ